MRAKGTELPAKDMTEGGKSGIIVTEYFSNVIKIRNSSLKMEKAKAPLVKGGRAAEWRRGDCKVW